jgi:DNA/RNA endonuclease YhcR with UshA esterase domain
MRISHLLDTRRVYFFFGKTEALGRAGSLFSSLEAQVTDVIRDTEAIEYVGQNVTVEGTVVAVFRSKNGNTFLNFGGPYPHQTFTGWIPKASELPDRLTLAGLEGKKVKITGTINLYKGKPEIKIVSKDQLTPE